MEVHSDLNVKDGEAAGEGSRILGRIQAGVRWGKWGLTPMASVGLKEREQVCQVPTVLEPVN